MLNRLKQQLHRIKPRPTEPEADCCWEYKVVQMVAQEPADPADASKRLGGVISPEALRSQFPEHYGGGNGRQQICEFLNQLGADRWELVQVQQIGGLPLMIFKRPLQLPSPQNLATDQAAAPLPHAEQQC